MDMKINKIIIMITIDIWDILNKIIMIEIDMKITMKITMKINKIVIIMVKIDVWDTFGILSVF